jgi:hypothetical protein
MLALALLAAAAGAAPAAKPAAVTVEATATVRIVRPVKITAVPAPGVPPSREMVIPHPDGSVERIRVVDLP